MPASLIGSRKPQNLACPCRAMQGPACLPLELSHARSPTAPRASTPPPPLQLAQQPRKQKTNQHQHGPAGGRLQVRVVAHPGQVVRGIPRGLAAVAVEVVVVPARRGSARDTWSGRAGAVAAGAPPPPMHLLSAGPQQPKPTGIRTYVRGSGLRCEPCSCCPLTRCRDPSWSRPAQLAAPTRSRRSQC